jgi:hypothetical protein
MPCRKPQTSLSYGDIISTATVQRGRNGRVEIRGGNPRQRRARLFTSRRTMASKILGLPWYGSHLGSGGGGRMRMAFELKEEFDPSRKSPLSATIDIDRSTFPIRCRRLTAGIAEDYHQQRAASTAILLQAIVARLPTGLRQASPAMRRSSVSGSGRSREKRRVRGEPARYELREEPHALRLACLPLCEKPNRSVHVQVGARRPHQ